MRNDRACWWSVCLVLAGCVNGGDADPSESQLATQPSGAAGTGGVVTGPVFPSAGTLGFSPTATGGTSLFGSIGGSQFNPPEKDIRPVVKATKIPVAISGGTLVVSPDGAYAVAADPERDRVSIITLRATEEPAIEDPATDEPGTRQVRHIQLQEGAEPGRVVLDGQGRAHVALRRAGAVSTLDLISGQELYQRPVCGAPRGLALDVSGESLWVACADGEVVELGLADGAQRSRFRVRSEQGGVADLRDIAVDGQGLILSRFKSAELMTVDRTGVVKGQRSLQPVQQPNLFVPEDGMPAEDSELVETLRPNTAWRTRQMPDGSFVMLHGLASERTIKIASATAEFEHSADGGLPTEPVGAVEPGPGQGYGGGGSGCSGIAQNAMSLLGAAEGSVTQTQRIGMPGLVVDVASRPGTQEFAFARPGAADDEAPQTTINIGDERQEGEEALPVELLEFFEEDLRRSQATNASTLLVVHVESGQGFRDGGCATPTAVDVDGQVTAVAYGPDGALFAQSREPAALYRVVNGVVAEQVMLGGDSMLDTGHELFHRNSGGGIACAQCHPEGGEDGHVWNFSDVGPRRTQPLFVKVSNSAPFHWGGDIADFKHLMDEVFVGRMGGAEQSNERTAHLASWLLSLSPPKSPRLETDAAVLRGKAIFESQTVGCMDCHAGSAFSDNESHDVGIPGLTEETQTPSLLGVAYRAPFMHTGCAETLEQRFDPACGGTTHGNVAGLSAQQIDDLVGYLSSL